ncbi:MAG TPA: nuclear transport factor 2 family protein [Solirubrobacteraceae bacterium]|nr:nuclear transport factor 2 family protein [Solirubrobacteraceae bacterium]
MADAVSRYCAASEARDIDALMATLAPDATLVSPLSANAVFRGHEDLRILLTAVYGSMSELRWVEQIGEGTDMRVSMSEGRVIGARIGDAMVFDLDGDGLIRRIRPHLRPWFATTLLALLLGPKVARHPGVVLRALRGD